MTNGDCLHCKTYSKSAFLLCDAGQITKVMSDNNLFITFRKGQDIYLENTPAKGVFCIKKGKIKVYKACDGRHLTVELCTNGDMLGVSSMYGGSYINSARCLEDSQVCFIPEKLYKKLLHSNMELSHELLRRASSEEAHLMNLITSFKCNNILNRIARTLGDVEKKFGCDEQGWFNVVLTRRDISEMSGTTTESAIRILNDLRKEKIIAIQNKRFKIIDPVKLQKYQSFQS